MFKFSQKISLLIIITFAVSLTANVSFAKTPEENANSPESVLAKETKTTPSEIEVRKQILKEILDLSLSEIKNLKESLEKLDLTSSEWKEVKEKLLEALGRSEDHYKEIQGNLEKNDYNLDEIKAIAKGLKEWRGNIYTPQLNAIINMLLIFQNDDLLKTTRSRLNKIENDIKKISKQNYIKTEGLKIYFDQAAQTLKDARDANEKAKAIFLEIEKVDNDKGQNLGAKISQTQNNDAEQTKNHETIRKLLIDSLKNIKNTYEIFFQMNLKIKNLFK